MAKRGSAADEIYASHLFGLNRRFKSNPGKNQEARIAAMYSRILSDIAMNRFKWSNLPRTGDQRFVELCLLYQALAVAYIDKRWNKFIIVKGSGIGYSTVFDNPVSFTVISPGEGLPNDAQFGNLTLSAYDPVRHDHLSDDAKRKKAVPIWANALRQPDMDIINIYATRLASIERTLEINSKNARRNKIIKGTPQMSLSLVNLARAIDQGEELLQVTGPLEDLEAIDTIDLGIEPDSYEKLSLLRTRWWNECMTLLGIDSANQDKKERLVAAEVSANDSQADSIRFMNLQARQKAAEQINEIFGENISVEYNLEIEAEEALAKATEAVSKATNKPDGEAE